jgi:hypothetical protein
VQRASESGVSRAGITGGQAGDAPAAAQILPLVTPGADPAHDTNVIREACAERKAWASIPPGVACKDAFAFSAWVCRQRNLV